MEINQPGSYLDHMVRQTRIHHVELSSMADLKANMLITMASVVITISLPQAISSDLQLAAVALIIFSMITIVLAVYATMPHLPYLPYYKVRNEIDPHSSDFNPLFFGHFIYLSYERYQEVMEEYMNDPNKAYEVQIRELYTLGKFLARRKYRVLKLAYLSFMTGLLGSGAIAIAGAAVL